MITKRRRYVSYVSTTSAYGRNIPNAHTWLPLKAPHTWPSKILCAAAPPVCVKEHMLRNPWSSAQASMECIYGYAYTYAYLSIYLWSRGLVGKHRKKTSYTQENAATIKNNHPTQSNSRPCTHKTQSLLHMPPTPRPLKKPRTTKLETYKIGGQPKSVG